MPGVQEDIDVKISLKMPLEFNSFSKVREAQRNYESARYKTLNFEDELIEEVKNTWQALEIAQANFMALRDQAKITEGFLELAREERQLGNRSLLDVLSGETSLFNSLSDARQAEIRVQIAAYELLEAIGKLTVDNL